MNKIITALAIFAAAVLAATAQTYRIRVTDPDGNVATATIAATGRVALVSAWVDDAMAALGTNRAEKLAAHLETVARAAAIGHRLEARRAAARAAYDAAVNAPVE